MGYLYLFAPRGFLGTTKRELLQWTDPGLVKTVARHTDWRMVSDTYIVVKRFGFTRVLTSVSSFWSGAVQIPEHAAHTHTHTHTPMTHISETVLSTLHQTNSYQMPVNFYRPFCRTVVSPMCVVSYSQWTVYVVAFVFHLQSPFPPWLSYPVKNHTNVHAHAQRNTV